LEGSSREGARVLVVSTGENSSFYLQRQRLPTGGKPKSKLLKGKRIRILNGPDLIFFLLLTALFLSVAEMAYVLGICLFGENTGNSR
jgi:hypothetical protein